MGEEVAEREGVEEWVGKELNVRVGSEWDVARGYMNEGGAGRF